MEEVLGRDGSGSREMCVCVGGGGGGGCVERFL